MPRYVIERFFPEGLAISLDAEEAQTCLAVVAANGEDGVAWVRSHVNPERTEIFCFYDSSSPGAIRRAARRNGLSVERTTQASTLNPYLYKQRATSELRLRGGRLEAAAARQTRTPLPQSGLAPADVQSCGTASAGVCVPIGVMISTWGAATTAAESRQRRQAGGRVAQIDRGTRGGS